jgi:hypothetical protein
VRLMVTGMAAGVIAAGAAGVVIAHASSPHAAKAEGGLALTSTTISRQAVAGSTNFVKVTNNSDKALAVTVKPRPWIQSSSARVVPNRRATLSQVGVNADSFTLAPGSSKDVLVTLKSVPTGGYLYGALEIIGMPSTKGKGLITAYRLIGVLRYNAARASYGLKAGATKIVKNGKSKMLALSVKNAGNTITPITGDVRMKGPLGTRQSSVKSTKVLPGKTVALSVMSASGLPAGRYTATISLKQGTYSTKLTKKISVRR